MLTEKAPENNLDYLLRNISLIHADRLPKYVASEDVIISLEAIGTIARHHDPPVFFTNSTKDPIQGTLCTVYMLWFNGLRMYSSSDPVDFKAEKSKKEEIIEVP